MGSPLAIGSKIYFKGTPGTLLSISDVHQQRKTFRFG